MQLGQIVGGSQSSLRDCVQSSMNLRHNETYLAHLRDRERVNDESTTHLVESSRSHFRRSHLSKIQGQPSQAILQAGAPFHACAWWPSLSTCSLALRPSLIVLRPSLIRILSIGSSSFFQLPVQIFPALPSGLHNTCQSPTGCHKCQQGQLWRSISRSP